MNTNVAPRELSHVIELPETFNYSNHKGFRSSYTPVLADSHVREILIDFRSTTYIDSAALGMLLMLRKSAEAAGKLVALINATGTVREILDIAHFETLFSMR